MLFANFATDNALIDVNTIKQAKHMKMAALLGACTNCWAIFIRRFHYSRDPIQYIPIEIRSNLNRFFSGTTKVIHLDGFYQQFVFYHTIFIHQILRWYQARTLINATNYYMPNISWTKDNLSTNKRFGYIQFVARYNFQCRPICIYSFTIV